MTVGFYTVFRSDPQHFLHAAALVREVSTVMPGVPVVQLTDEKTPDVPGVTAAIRLPHGPMLERRIEHYAQAGGYDDWLFVDTDVSIRQDVRSVFDNSWFDVAVTDRNWPHLPQTAEVLQTMPFNTGVVFSRRAEFWQEVLRVWREYPEPSRDWMSEQRAVAEVVKTGRFRVTVLPGMVYNYPPSAADAKADAAIWHYKGPHRKVWLSTHATAILGQPARVEACV